MRNAQSAGTERPRGRLPARLTKHLDYFVKATRCLNTFGKREGHALTGRKHDVNGLSDRIGLAALF